MNKIQLFLKGKKSYILGTLMFLISLEKYLTGDTTASQFVTTVQGILGFNGLGVVTLRAAVAKVSPQPATPSPAAGGTPSDLGKVPGAPTEPKGVQPETSTP